MERSFRDRFGGAALITGASAGIGATFAEHLAAAKMDLVLVARRRDRLESKARELAQAHGVRVEVIDLDLASPGATADLVARAAKTGLDVGLLVCSAGFGGYGPFVEGDAAHDARMVDLNCRVVVEHCHAFLPKMVERGRGGVILLASTAAYQPCPYWATYGATKAFNLMLGEALWAEVGPKGVDVLALSPGYTKTEFQEAAHIDVGGVGPELDVNDVVRSALSAIGKRPSTLVGLQNWLMAFSSRFTPRSLVAKISAKMSHPDTLRKKRA
ncbi:MAG: SDR family oxidoreductase [Polyangiaceae bacterium]